MSLFKDRMELEIQEAELGAQKVLGQFPPLLKWLLIFCLAALIPAYYIAKSISQNIWQRRYSQNALTAKPSFSSPKDPSVSAVSVTSLGPGQYAAVVLASNQNLDLSADDVPYQFQFYNAQKQLVYSYSNTLFFLPNQTKYISVPTFSSTDQIAYADFVFPQAIAWQKRLNVVTVNLVTSQPSSYQQASPPAFVVAGDFTNQSPYTLNQVRLTFVLSDGFGKIIGVSQRDEFTVAPFEQRTYKQLWPQIQAANLSKIRVTADTDSLNPLDLIVQTAPNNSSSNLGRPAGK
jgi:hypothetical protein